MLNDCMDASDVPLVLWLPHWWWWGEGMDELDSSPKTHSTSPSRRAWGYLALSFGPGRKSGAESLGYSRPPAPHLPTQALTNPAVSSCWTGSGLASPTPLCLWDPDSFHRDVVTKVSRHQPSPICPRPCPTPEGNPVPLPSNSLLS